MSGKNNITVRKQKIRKNHTKAKLVFFLVLTALLLFVAAFAKRSEEHTSELQSQR